MCSDADFVCQRCVRRLPHFGGAPAADVALDVEAVIGNKRINVGRDQLCGGLDGSRLRGIRGPCNQHCDFAPVRGCGCHDHRVELWIGRQCRRRFKCQLCSPLFATPSLAACEIGSQGAVTPDEAVTGNCDNDVVGLDVALDGAFGLKFERFAFDCHRLERAVGFVLVIAVFVENVGCAVLILCDLAMLGVNAPGANVSGLIGVCRAKRCESRDDWRDDTCNPEVASRGLRSLSVQRY
jgi:hypothetical protein